LAAEHLGRRTNPIQAEWLAKNRPELISAAFALNEGGGGRTDGHGKVVLQSIQPGGWIDPDGNGVHGLNERRSARSVFIGRDFLTDLVKSYAEAD